MSECDSGLLTKKFIRAVYCEDIAEIVAVFETTTRPSRTLTYTADEIDVEYRSVCFGHDAGEFGEDHLDANCSELQRAKDAIRTFGNEPK